MLHGRPREGLEVLLTQLAEGYECGSVLISSNPQFSKWEGIFKTYEQTAAVDGLLHRCVILELNIPGYRVEGDFLFLQSNGFLYVEG